MSVAKTRDREAEDEGTLRAGADSRLSSAVMCLPYKCKGQSSDPQNSGLL